jgi:hypothetical protein
MTTSNSISENAISFYASGGHAHDGVTSSLIKTNSYSIYDFNPSFIGDNPERRRAQVNNYNSFRQLVVNTINSTVLEPAGIVLQDNIINSRNIISGSITATEIAANTITADNIAAGTITANNIAANTITANNIATGAITADELSSNIVLVNNYITSNNFNGTIAANGAVTAAGNTGWAITSFGHAVFDTTFIRGSLSASEVLTPGVDIYSNGTLAGGSFTLYGNGAIVTSSGNFSVDASGNLYAENATIYGEINATSGSIAGWSISTDTISADSGNISLYQEAGYGALIAGTGAGSQIILNSDAQLHAEFGGVDTDINFQTDSAYVFRITDGSQLARISPSLISFVSGGNFSVLSYDSIYTTGEAGMSTGLIGGIGITYPGCTTGPGTANYMGLVWNNPDIRGTVDNVVSTVLGTVSDVRSKSYILDAEDTWLNKLYDSLRVVSFNPVDLLDEENLHLYPRRLGLIAQELNEILPDLVVSANPYDEEAFLSVNYLGLVPYLIQAVQDLNNRVKELENEV